MPKKSLHNVRALATSHRYAFIPRPVSRLRLRTPGNMATHFHKALGPVVGGTLDAIKSGVPTDVQLPNLVEMFRLLQ